MPWIWAALMPHPPIIVPAVGRGRENEAAATLAGAATLLEKLAARPARGRPDALFILSPHQPWARGALFLNSAPALQGSLSRFGAPGVKFSLKTAEEWPELARHLETSGLPPAVSAVPDLSPDHGSLVPLSFLARIFDPVPPVVLASPIGLTPRQALELGRALAAFSEKNWALLASGDLSHRLTPAAPAGFSPEGAAFDRAVVEALTSGQSRELLDDWPDHRLERAGECGFRSALALLGLAGGPVDVLSYEGPFGVGYAHALWLNDTA